MLEGVLAQVVESAVGKYVDGIDKKAAKLSVWSGKIVMRDLKLKPSVSGRVCDFVRLLWTKSRIGRPRVLF